MARDPLVLNFVRYFWHTHEPKTRAMVEGWPAHFELGVIASLPMNHQIDLVSVDASNDLNNDGA
jgi:hypothetical protein